MPKSTGSFPSFRLQVKTKKVALALALALVLVLLSRRWSSV